MLFQLFGTTVSFSEDQLTHIMAGEALTHANAMGAVCTAINNILAVCCDEGVDKLTVKAADLRLVHCGKEICLLTADGLDQIKGESPAHVIVKDESLRMAVLPHLSESRLFDSGAININVIGATFDGRFATRRLQISGLQIDVNAIPFVLKHRICEKLNELYLAADGVRPLTVDQFNIILCGNMLANFKGTARAFCQELAREAACHIVPAPKKSASLVSTSLFVASERLPADMSAEKDVGTASAVSCSRSEKLLSGTSAGSEKTSPAKKKCAVM